MQSNTAMLGNAINTLLRQRWGNKIPLNLVSEVGKMYLHHGGEWKAPLGAWFRLQGREMNADVGVFTFLQMKGLIIKENKYSQ